MSETVGGSTLTELRRIRRGMNELYKLAGNLMSTTDSDMVLMELCNIRRELETHRKLLRRIKVGVDVWLTIVIITLLPLVLIVVVLGVGWVFTVATGR